LNRALERRFGLSTGGRPAELARQRQRQNPSQAVRACLGKLGDVDLQPLTPGVSVS
jgi:hypothetical protein